MSVYRWFGHTLQSKDDVKNRITAFLQKDIVGEHSSRNRIWRYQKLSILKKESVVFIKEFSELSNLHLTVNFYESTYLCPNCKKYLFKTQFPVGNEYGIDTDRGKYYMKRVFTCPWCKIFYTAANSKLGDGEVYLYISNTEIEYDELLDELDSKGSLKPRSD